MNRTVLRNHVYSAIDSERDYQDRMSANPDRPDMVEDLPLSGILLAMEHCLNSARASWYYDNEPYHATMHFIRKIAGLSVKAGETYGMPKR